MRDDSVAQFQGIDSHAHVFERSLQPTDSPRYVPDYDAPLAEYLALLARNEFSHGVLVQPSFLGTDNHYLMMALATNPNVLRGVAVVDPEVSAEELSAMASAGVRGVRLNLIGRPLPNLRDSAWKGLLHNLSALGLHVEIHRAIGDVPGLVEPLLEAGCKVVVDHFGRADACLGQAQHGFTELLDLGASGRLWIKISGLYRLGGSALDQDNFAQQVLPLMVRQLGANRLLWGSDWPHTQHEHTVTFSTELARIRKLVSTLGVERQTLRDSAAQLFGILP